MADARRQRRAAPPVTPSLRPPRYRLLSAAARLPRRPSVEPSETFERECPACGTTVVFTQVHGESGIGYTIEDHGCHE